MLFTIRRVGGARPVWARAKGAQSGALIRSERSLGAKRPEERDLNETKYNLNYDQNKSQFAAT